MMLSQQVLLVEDNADDEALALRAFKNHPYVQGVAVVRDGVEALEYLFAEGRYSDRDKRQQPCLVLLDMKLPRLSGLDVLRRIRSDPRTRYNPVVLMTSSKQDADMAAGYSLGANSYIQKPVNFDEFSQMLKLLGEYWANVNKLPNTPYLENYH